MSHNQSSTHNPIPVSALTGSMFDYARAEGADLIGRTRPFDNWRQCRLDHHVWPFSRIINSAPGAKMDIADEAGQGREGISLACQDYLGLTSHPRVREAAVKALHDLGPHSAGSPALAGNTSLSLLLETRLSEALKTEHIVLFPTGWAAGYGSITGLVRPTDHIVMDQLAHACLQQGAFAATRNVFKHPHCDNNAVKKILQSIRAEDKANGIMVITEGLFSMDSDVPDIAPLQDICREFNATLFVDVAHDFGSMGENGGGSLAMQNMLGKVDLVMGSFSKTFSSNGGFLATSSRAVKQYIKFYGSPQTFSNGLSPVQAAVVLEALSIVRSAEGKTLREKLNDNAVKLRKRLENKNIHCIGVPSAIVPAHIGSEAVGRIAWAYAQTQGVHANLVEFPAVAVGSARFRMQLMPSHTPEQMSLVSDIIAASIDHAQQEVKKIEFPAPKRARYIAEAGTFSIAGKALPALSQDDMQKLLSAATKKTFAKEAILIKEGTQPDGLFVITRGTATVEIDYLGDRLVLAECGEGEVLGEMSLLTTQKASATVVAHTDVEAMLVDRETLAKQVTKDPGFGTRFYQSLAIVLANRLRHKNSTAVPSLISG
ncbi:MAG: aminotransferase class I/II-fold pyridoxal phosphate-dependent enzyme [Deltaproteobacteria bacterium]|nr:aminotransferase class I/II-fold pyridoxal phosphate-dependent enzyme [Deltaproteobacteria bacterium]